MAGEHREAMAIFEAAKASLDPDGIFNPGKMGLRREARAMSAALDAELVAAVGAEHVERSSTIAQLARRRPARPPRSPR